MKDSGSTMDALGRAGRRVAYHMIQAAIEGLKAVEAVLEEVGGLRETEDQANHSQSQRIEIE